jgi:hypothetical protein
MSSESPIHRRWLPRFSLRTLLIAITLNCLVVGWYGSQIIEYRRQQQLVERIPIPTRFWIGVSWDKQSPTWLSWFNHLQMSDPFRRITSIGCDSPNSSSLVYEIVDLIPQLPTIKHVYLPDMNLDDDILSRLAKCSQLETLTLQRAPGDGRYWTDEQATAIYLYCYQLMHGATPSEESPETNGKDTVSMGDDQKLLDARISKVRQQLPGVVVQWQNFWCD